MYAVWSQHTLICGFYRCIPANIAIHYHWCNPGWYTARCGVYRLVVRFNAYQISASIDAKNNGFTRELRCPPVLIYFTQACREAGVRLVQVTLKDWTLNAFRRNASSAGWP